MLKFSVTSTTSAQKLYDEQSIFKMLNFFSENEIKTRKEALTFIYKYKKYESMMRASETLNLNKRPIDFVKYCSNILKTEKVALGLQKSKSHHNLSTQLQMNSNNARQIFDQAFLENLDDIHKSYLDVSERLYTCTLPQPKTKLELYMVAQTLVDCLRETLIDYKNFLLKEKNYRFVYSPQKGVSQFESAIKFVNEFYGEQINNHGNDIWTIDNVCTDNLKTLSRNFFRHNFINNCPNNNLTLCIDPSFFKVKILKIINWISKNSIEKNFEIDEQNKLEIFKQLSLVLNRDWDDKKRSANNNTFIIYGK
jgi:hypothetical protein